MKYRHALVGIVDKDIQLASLYLRLMRNSNTLFCVTYIYCKKYGDTLRGSIGGESLSIWGFELRKIFCLRKPMTLARRLNRELLQRTRYVREALETCGRYADFCFVSLSTNSDAEEIMLAEIILDKIGRLDVSIEALAVLDGHMSGRTLRNKLDRMTPFDEYGEGKRINKLLDTMITIQNWFPGTIQWRDISASKELLDRYEDGSLAIEIISRLFDSHKEGLSPLGRTDIGPTHMAEEA